jgi:hypothetical protein
MKGQVSIQESVHVHQKIPGGNLRESFQWAPEEYIRFLAQTEAGSIYRVRAIHVTEISSPDSTMTRNGVEFTEDELKLAARSLGYRPLDLNHEPPFLEFPQNRVIDAEYEDSRVEAVIAVRDTGAMSMIEAKKIVAVSVEAIFRWADVVCNDQACWLRPVGIIFTGLGLLTPGVLPGDPLASIVTKKAPCPASPVIPGTTQKVDTTPKGGGVILEKKQAAPPPEQQKEKTETTTPTTTQTVAEAAEQDPSKETEVKVDADCAQKVLEAVTTLTGEVKGLKEHVGSIESQVKLLHSQRLKGSRSGTRTTTAS